MMQVSVSLHELAAVKGRPLEEKAVWAILKRTVRSVVAALADGNRHLLIAPDAILFRIGGHVKVLEGVYDNSESRFLAGQAYTTIESDIEKIYVYSLGACMREVGAGRGDGSLHFLLTAMMNKEPARRPSLQNVLTSCADLGQEDEEEEIEGLLSLVFGQPIHDDVVSVETEENTSQENLEKELNLALEQVCSSSRKESGPYAMEGLLQRRGSSRSIGVAELSRLSTSFIPRNYHSSMQEGLDSCSPEIMHRAVSLTLTSQDISLLASNASLKYQSSPQPQPRAESIPSLPISSPPHSSPPSLPPSPPTSHLPIYPESNYTEVLTSFQTLDDLPPLPPPLPLSPHLLHPSLSFSPHSSNSSNSSSLNVKSALPTTSHSVVASEVKSSTLQNEGGNNSFDYTELVGPCHIEPATCHSSEEEFEFCPLKVPGETCVGERMQVEALYATVDKSKKTKTREEEASHGDTGNTCAPTERVREECEEELPPPPLPPPLQSEPDEFERTSGIYEEVGVGVQLAVANSGGYTEVGGGRRPVSQLEVGYSGIGSFNKLQEVLGPEFSTLTGRMVNKPRITLPPDRRYVSVVLLNGKTVEYAVDVNAVSGQLFEQVLSSQSLQETHVFGLALRDDGEDIFLEMDHKLVKYAPKGWSNSSKAFTVFFLVKYYVENLNRLIQPLTRHLFYLQLRKDIIEGKMFCHEDHVFHLTALAIITERNTTDHKFQIEDYIPFEMVQKRGKQYLEGPISMYLHEKSGLTPSEAELEFLQEAQKLVEYGLHFYKVAKTKRERRGSVWLGFCLRGIVIFDVHRGVKVAKNHCSWKNISNLSFANRKFVIKVEDKQEPFVFFATSYRRARYLFDLSKSCHKFHLVWAKDSCRTTDEVAMEMCVPDDCKETDAVVEYPSPSRPQSSLLDGTSSSTIVKVVLKGRKDDVESFGIHLMDYNKTEGLYVEDVVAGSVSEGEIMTGDQLMAINGVHLNNYRQTINLLRESDQIIVELQRRKTHNLPQGECVSVSIAKEGDVLGIRIAGGSDKTYGGGLVRIKQVTADTVGSRSGVLVEGDIILKVNSISLIGMTHRQAADTIMMAEHNVILQLHRPANPYWWRTHSYRSTLPATITSPTYSNTNTT